MVLDRLTTDNPQRNIEVLLNWAYAEDGRVKLRAAGGEEGVDLCEYIEQQRRELGFDCGVFASDVMDGTCMECDCVLAILNIVAIQAAELRSKLAYYEDLDERAEANRALSRRALETYGAEAQTRMVFEEFAELQKELCKHARGKDNRMEIAEEIADVFNVLDQMIILYDCADEVAAFREEKLERLADKLDKNEREEG